MRKKSDMRGYQQRVATHLYEHDPLRGLTQEYVRMVLDYDPLTGVLRWRPRPIEMFGGRKSVWVAWSAKNEGKIAGSVDPLDGYVRLGLLGKLHKAHRVIWVYMTGTCPEKVDHDNRIRHDNRWVNLVEADSVKNGRNQKKHVTNTSGATGVHWHKRDQHWTAYVGVDGKPVWLGAFDTFDEAVAARQNAERSLGYHENHGR